MAEGYESKVGEWIRERGYEPGDELQKLLNARMLPTTQEARSAKLSLLLLGWINGDELSSLGNRCQCYAGTILSLTDEVSWLVDAAAEIAEVMGWASATQLSELAERARLGVDTPSLELARLSCPDSTVKKSRRWCPRGSIGPWPCVRRPQKPWHPTCRRHKLRCYARPETHLSNRTYDQPTSCCRFGTGPPDSGSRTGRA